MFLIKKFLFILTFNFSLFLLLMLGIQNSSKKETVNLLINESVNLPISFIVGMSFISGSLTGGLLKLNFLPEKKEKL